MKNNKHTIKELVSNLFFFLLPAFIFEIPAIKIMYPGLNNILVLLQILTSLVATWLMFKHGKISKIQIAIFLYLLLYVANTLVQNGAIVQCLQEAVATMAYSLIIEYGVRYKGKNIVKGQCFFYLIIVLINIVSMYIYPRGLYISSNLQYTTSTNWILGYRNLHILFIMPMLLWCSLYDYYYCGKLNKFCLIAVVLAFISVVKAESTTSIIGIIVWGISILIISKNIARTKNRILSKVLLGYLVAYVSIIFLRIQDFLDKLIFKITNKHSDFSGRSYIWDSTFELIKEKAIFGYGREESLVRQSKTASWQVVHAHNEVLEIVYRTGVVGMLIFAVTVAMSMRALKNELNRYPGIIILATIIAYAVMTLTEYFSILNIIPIFTLAYHAKRIKR